MDIDERIYFNNLTNYKPKGIKNIIYPEIRDEITYLSVKIRNTAREALSEEISPNNAKKEISDLLNNIKKLDIENVNKLKKIKKEGKK